MAHLSQNGSGIKDSTPQESIGFKGGIISTSPVPIDNAKVVADENSLPYSGQKRMEQRQGFSPRRGLLARD